MTVAVAPAPSMFAVFRRRDFTLLWVSQLVSTAGSSLTVAGRRDLRLARDRVHAGGRPDPDGDGHPEPRRRVACRRVRRPPRPPEDHDRDQPHPGGLRRPDRGRHRDRGDRLARAVPAVAGRRGRQAVLRSRPRQPDPRGRQRRGAGGGQLVPVDRVVRLDRGRVRRRGAAGRHGRAAVGVHPRFRVVPVLGRLHRADGPLPDAEAGRGCQRAGHRREPEGGHGDADRNAGHPLDLHRRRR